MKPRRIEPGQLARADQLVQLRRQVVAVLELDRLANGDDGRRERPAT